MLILKIYIVSFGLQLLGWPVIKMFFKRLPDEGWALGRVVITLFTALLIWQMSYLGFLENNSRKVFAILALFGLTSLWLIFTNGTKAFSVPKTTVKIMAIEEYLFFMGFLVMALIRGHSPALDSLEKFMDFGFLNQYLVSPTLPAMDMWQAGQTINYYSFGHFWASVLVRVWGVAPTIGYNLMLAFIFGTCLSLVFLACKMLSGNKNSRGTTIGGLVGALAVMVAGNSHVIWYFIKNRGVDSYWYAEATRFIHNTIHEFPSYSFVVSDLHGHVLDLPIILIFLIVMLAWVEKKDKIYEVVMGVLFGVMMMTNTWDVAVYGLVLLVLGIQIIVSNPRDLKKLFVSAGVILFSATIVAIPWWLSFQSISSGVFVVEERSPFWQLLVLWGGGIVINILAVITEGKGEKKMVTRTLALSALFLLIIPELFYAKDIYPNHPRANTMFKLTYQAFIIMGILLGATLGKLLDKERVMIGWWRVSASVLIFVFFLGTMVFPAKAFPTYYAGFTSYFGLDGEAWMKTKIPENYGAMKYLSRNINGKNMVEAVGDSYTLLNAVSAFSGVPTIQGWRVHEWLWRSGYDSVATREAEVREIYQGEDVYKTLIILKKYNIGWILVGQDEKITYKVNEEKIWQLGKMVWKQGATYLIEVE
ncbi:MAG TPA: DUF2298 domain-containing protein [Spirochaetia bacterium]|nr:DUF2298 domain-containing protein [Spirochaetia bacterium]